MDAVETLLRRPSTPIHLLASVVSKESALPESAPLTLRFCRKAIKVIWHGLKLTKIIDLTPLKSRKRQPSKGNNQLSLTLTFNLPNTPRWPAYFLRIFAHPRRPVASNPVGSLCMVIKEDLIWAIICQRHPYRSIIRWKLMEHALIDVFREFMASNSGPSPGYCDAWWFNGHFNLVACFQPQFYGALQSAY